MTSYKKSSKKLHKLAYYNDLTGAPNLVKFKEDAEKLIMRNPEETYAIVRFNVDKLSLLNEIYSYQVGDKILQCIVQALKQITNIENETYGNMLGDRFFVLFVCSSFDELAKRKVDFEKYFYDCMGNDISHKIKFPSGWYIIEKVETNISSIIEKANFAHLIARQTKLANNEIQCYDERMKRAALFEKEIESKMHESLDNKCFKMFLQPKYRIMDEKMVGAEALVKWDMDGSILSPGSFIPIFEKNGFIIRLDMYMFEQACIFLRKLLNEGRSVLKVSVNFSRLHLSNENYVMELCNIADKYEIPHDLLEIELMESTILENQDALLNMLDELHKNGFTLSIDDFGSGYSSLGLLKDILIDVVKFDRSFFENARDFERAWLVISSTIFMAKKLNIQVVAEGIEKKEHLDMLREIGCDIVQGFYFARPMPSEEFISKYLIL